MIDILSLTRAQLERLASSAIPEAAGASPLVYASVFATGRLDPVALGLGPAKAEAWLGAFRATRLQVERLVEEPGELGTTAKAVVRLEDGLSVECVRVPMAVRERDEDRGTLCVSSQVGCRMGCTLCETGRRGLARSLSAGEIVGQVLAARLVLGWSFRNLVFMGMGEPLDDAEAAFAAIEALQDRSGLGFAQDRITLCTAGHVEGLGLLASRGWNRLRLSVSLNAGTDATRSRLMPINDAWPLADLASALREYHGGEDSAVILNYCLIPGLNDSPAEAEGVAAFVESLRPARAKVNLIPYNPGSAPIGRSPSEAEVDAFVARLACAGLVVRRRATHGRSIMAACGQLGGPIGP